MNHDQIPGFKQILDEIVTYLDKNEVEGMDRFSNALTIRMGSNQVYNIWIADGVVHTQTVANGVVFNLSDFQIADPECFDKIKKVLAGTN